MKRLLILAAAAALVPGAAAFGQAPLAPPSPQPGILGRLHHSPQPGMAPGQMPSAGGIVGNKRTHVYHLAGDKGSLPAPKNRVFFRSVAEAQAHGYHAAGQHSPRSRPTFVPPARTPGVPPPPR